MSCDIQQLSKNTEHFKLLCSFKFEDTIPLSLYRSEITEITVCIAEVDGPFIDGDFNIVTETCDGLAYAVKHLIFMGTNDYPYKNILKLWAKKSLASDIRGATFRNRTCFTMRAAGSEGFLNLMQKYLEHIFFPSLEDSAYLTEVHHITGKGHHRGVQYLKTKKMERMSLYILRKKILCELYPQKQYAYNLDILGTTQNLRESTTNEKVKQFHEKFYRPENLTILITGKIQPDEIFQALLPLEEKLMVKKKKDKCPRPWETRIEPLQNSIDVEIFFPVQKEEYGEVHVAWRGPSPITQLNDYRGCIFLLQYLTKTISSPFTKEHKISDSQVFITQLTIAWPDPYLEIIFNNVPMKQIDLITKTSIHKILRTIRTNGINMDMMKSLIYKAIFEHQSKMENNPHTKISNILFYHLTYVNTDNLSSRLNFLRDLEKLKDKSEEDFLTLLEKYFVDAPMVVVKGKPSSNMLSKLQEEETNVIEQTKKLGRHFLRQKEKELQEAIKKKNKIVPDEDLLKVPMPGIDSINFHHIERYNTETAKQHPKLDVKKLPLFTYLDDVDTNFFYLHIIMDTSFFSPEDKAYIPLITQVITESPITREDQLIPYEKVKDLLVADNIKVQSCIGINTSEQIHATSLILQAELHNYEKTVQWCKELLYDTILPPESLKQKAMTILELVQMNMLQGKNLLSMLITTLLYSTKQFTYNQFRQFKFHTEMPQRFITDVGQNEVMKKIENVRQTLTSSKNMFVYMAVNVNKLTEKFPDVYAPWNKCFSKFTNLEKTKVNIKSNLKVLKIPCNIYNGYIMGLTDIHSLSFIQTCPCINNFQDSDLPAFEVCLTYLKQEGGPIWKEIRGSQALSDHFDFYTNVDDGYLYLQFLKCRDIAAAYKRTQSIVQMYFARTIWNKFLYERAKSSVILNYINNVQTIKHVINASLTSYCKNLPHDYNSEMVRRVSAVTIDDMSRVTTQYIKPLFDPKQCKIAIVCNNEEVAEIKEAFQKMEFNFNVFKSRKELRNYIEKSTN